KPLSGRSHRLVELLHRRAPPAPTRSSDRYQAHKLIAKYRRKRQTYEMEGAAQRRVAATRRAQRTRNPGLDRSRSARLSQKAGAPEIFYSVDRSGLYQTGGTLDLWQQDRVRERPFWRLPDWFEADDLRTHVAELFPDGLSLHGWQFMVERHDFIRPTNSDALFVTHNMVVELVFEYVRRAVFPSRGSRFQSFFAWESLQMARAFRKEGQALYRVESSSIFRADQSWLTLGVQNAIASLSAHRY